MALTVLPAVSLVVLSVGVATFSGFIQPLQTISTVTGAMYKSNNKLNKFN